MKKIFAAACCAALLTMSIGTVCPAASSETESVSEEQKTVKVKKQIGEKTKGALKARLTNATGKDIKAFAIKEDSAEEFTENMLAEEEVLAQGEVGILYYAPENETADEEEAAYVLRLTFEDDTTADIHEFSFSKMKKARIRLKEGTAYLVYKDGEEKISTLEAEQELAKAEETAAQDAGGVIEYEDDYYEDVYYDNSSAGSDNSGYDGGSAGGDAGNSSSEVTGGTETSGGDSGSGGTETSGGDSGSAGGDASLGAGGDAGAAADENCLVGGLMN